MSVQNVKTKDKGNFPIKNEFLKHKNYFDTYPFELDNNFPYPPSPQYCLLTHYLIEKY